MGDKKRAKKAMAKVAKADRKATHKAAAKRRTAPVRVAGLLGEAADQPQLIAASLATIGAGLLSRRADLMRGGTRMLAAHLVATGLKSVLKARVDRSRPKRSLATGVAQLEAGTGTEDPDLNSFPSGHSAGAVAVARAASRDIEGVAMPAALATGAAAAAQMPTGNHYLSDVLVGGAIGWAAEALVSAVFDRVEPGVEDALERVFGGNGHEADDDASGDAGRDGGAVDGSGTGASAATDAAGEG